MIAVRRSAERGLAEHGWLTSRHTFSFADYHDPAHMGFSVLRVLNEDLVQPGGGFATHSHRDMEIVSVVLSGALEHRDSMGNGSVIRPGDVQLMRAGTGVTHSEFNASQEEPVHFLQVWIVPDRLGLAPAYGQEHFPEEARRNRLCTVASGDARDGSLHLHRDASIHAALFEAGVGVEHPLAPGRAAWVQVVRGEVAVAVATPTGGDGAATRGAVPTGDVTLAAGDGAAIRDEGLVCLQAATSTEFLLFDLPAPRG